MGAAVALAARVVLAVVLAVAAVAKLRVRDATRTQTIALVGERYGGLVATSLPLVELALAVLLVAWWSSVPGVLAAALLVVFTCVLLRAQQRRVPCPCFGNTRGGPVGPFSIVRNGVLLAYAVLASGSPSGAGAGATILATIVLGAVAALAVVLAR
jgi:hypothetical protein